MAKFKSELFYSADQWLEKAEGNLLEDPETHYLMVQAKNARLALENKLEEVMD